METAQKDPGSYGAGQPDGPATVEAIWALIRETNRGLKEAERIIEDVGRKQEETARAQKDTDRQIQETARQMKETDKKIGALTNRFGEVVEYMIVPNLIEKFNKLGFTFEKAHRNTKITDHKNGIFAEIDVFMENGDFVMVIETKTTPNKKDVNEHIERMEKLRAYADFHKDQRKYYGAIAGVVVGEFEKAYALEKGLYVIEPSGDAFTITKPDGAYAPKAW
jgi:hypothetical protein